METSKNIIVREVWKSNLIDELNLINNAIDVGGYRLISMDTEFPGTIFHLPSHYGLLSPSEHYFLMKKNVDALHLIQLGLTLSDSTGNLPHFFTGYQYVWQFNFCDFDPDIHRNNPDSISMLRGQGIDFEENKKNGIDSRNFAVKFYAMLFHLNPGPHKLTWITFHGSCDFAYFIKILTGSKLPGDLEGFMSMVQGIFFGMELYDLKIIANYLKIFGGLEKVRICLGLDRVAGKRHQAGSDSLMIMHAFIAVLKKHSWRMEGLSRFNHKLYGLSSN